MRKVEIMAPVGSFESLQAAIQAGADSVYFGIEQLNMRARSSINFTIEDLKEIKRRCSEQGIKTYLTLNTVLYDHDINLMKSIIHSAKEAEVDAVIAMDQAAIMYAREVGLTVHLSTQINITNVEALKFYAHFADVAVLSRELTLQQVQMICESVEKEQVKGPSGELMRIEVFVHGALCMAVSGKCYLSLHTHNSSANRGACKQNCRRTYEVKDDQGNELLIDNEYIMSPKDLCTVNFLDKIIETGVSVLKIEGRSKGPDYVFATVSAYAAARDAALAGKFTQAMGQELLEKLEKVYNRGFWGGYFLGKELGEWTDSDGSKAKRRREFLGNGIKYFPKIGVGEFKLKTGKLSVGDTIMVTGPTTGIFEMEVKEMRVENEIVQTVERNIPFSMQTPQKVRPSDKIFRIIEVFEIAQS